MEVTVYSAFWCPDCRVAKRFLQEHNIPFKDIDIESTPGAAEEVVKQTRQARYPTVCHRWQVGAAVPAGRRLSLQ